MEDRRMKSVKIVGLIIVSTMLQACVAGAIFTSAEAAKTVAQQRSVGSRIDDNGIALRINDAFIQNDIDNLFADVSTTIFEGRVMLTGTVKELRHKERAGELAWAVPGIVEVINEIEVTQIDLVDYSKDVWLANAVRSKLLLTKGIASSNYAISCVNRTVYLLGVARDETELQNAIEVARRIKGVKQVVSNVIMQDDPRRNQWAKRAE